MIIIDIDSLKNKRAKKIVCNFVSSKLAPVLLANKNKKVIFEPTEAIVWYSKHKLKIHDLESMGLPKIGEVYSGRDLLEFLNWMISEISKVSIKCKMGPVYKFHTTQIITDKFMKEIKLLGANPFPISFFSSGGTRANI